MTVSLVCAARRIGARSAYTLDSHSGGCRPRAAIPAPGRGPAGRSQAGAFVPFAAGAAVPVTAVVAPHVPSTVTGVFGLG